jgi:hypothetical protein
MGRGTTRISDRRDPLRDREERVDRGGKVTLRYDSKLPTIPFARPPKGRGVHLYVADRDVRVVTFNGSFWGSSHSIQR